MIAQGLLTILLAGVVSYAWLEYRRSPVIGLLALGAATTGLYFVWMPWHATRIAELAGIGRGVDLILYVWVAISLILLMNLHLKLRAQLELMTELARALTFLRAERASDAIPGPTTDRDPPRASEG